MKREIWRKIPGFLGYYEVSNLGRLRSWMKRGGGRSDKPIEIQAHDVGRVTQAALWCRHNCSYRRFTLSRLVADTFIRKLRCGDVIWFNDRDYTNCSVDNLTIVSACDRAAMSIMLGEKQRSPGRLNDRSVRRVLKLRRLGYSLKDVQKQTGIHWSTVSMISNKHIWGHVEAA